jgi:predicted DNA-binding ribbon-helix-helix protein
MNSVSNRFQRRSIEAVSMRGMGGAADKPVLICRNVSVNGRRTSLRMEPMLWDALCEICDRESVTVNQLCSQIDRRRGAANLTASIRVFIISYLRAAVAHSPVQGLEDTPANTASPLFRKAMDDAVPLAD